MSFVETIYHHKLAVTKILVLTILFVYLILHLIVTHGHEYIKRNWVNLRNNPYLAPLAGFFKKDDKKEGVIKMGIKSVMQLLWTYIKMFFKMLIKPFQFIINIVYKIIDAIKATLDKFRQQLAVIRKLLFNIIKKVMERLQDLASTFIGLFMRLRDIMKRSFATYQMMVYTMETMGLTLKSMMDGPVGDLAHLAADLGYVFSFFLLGPMSYLMFPSLWYCVFCFHPNTQISLENGSTKPIKNIRLGDNLEKGELEGILVFYQPHAKNLYNYKGDLVTGDHYLLEGTFKKVKESLRTTSTKIKSNLLYCLSTSNHHIITPNATYLDFCETSCKKILLRQKNRALEILNGHDKIQSNSEHLYQEGFHITNIDFPHVDQNCLPYRDNEKINNIIGIGEWRVDETIRWYCHYISGLIVTGSVLIYENNNWLPVYQSNNFRELVEPETHREIKKVFHWVSDNGTLQFNGLISRDLLEVHDISHHSLCSREAIS